MLVPSWNTPDPASPDVRGQAPPPTTRGEGGRGATGHFNRKAALPFLVIEDGDKTVARLHADGVEVVEGNAVNAQVFAATNPGGAKRLVLAIPNAFEAGQMILRARVANPALEVIARAHSDAEVDHLNNLGANTVIMGEREIARGIVELILDGTIKSPPPPLAGDAEGDQDQPDKAKDDKDDV